MQDTRLFPLAENIRVTRDGLVQSCVQLGRYGGTGEWRPLTISLRDPSRYPSVSFKMNGRHRAVKVHLVVIKSWRGEAPSPGMVCRHLDDDKANFHLDNLEWGTPIQNSRDAIRNGRFPKGEAHWRSKLTDDQRAHIAIAAHTGLGISILAREYGVTYAAAHYIAFGRRNVEPFRLNLGLE